MNFEFKKVNKLNTIYPVKGPKNCFCSGIPNRQRARQLRNISIAHITCCPFCTKLAFKTKYKWDIFSSYSASKYWSLSNILEMIAENNKYSGFHWKLISNRKDLTIDFILKTHQCLHWEDLIWNIVSGPDENKKDLAPAVKTFLYDVFVLKFGEREDVMKLIPFLEKPQSSP